MFVAVWILAVALAFVLRRLMIEPRAWPVSAEWIDDPAAARYRVIEDLLHQRALGRSERRRRVRLHLRSLRGDFDCASAALALLVAESARDRPDLAAILYRQKAQFAARMLALHWRLALHACGLG